MCSVRTNTRMCVHTYIHKRHVYTNSHLQLDFNKRLDVVVIVVDLTLLGEGRGVVGVGRDTANEDRRIWKRGGGATIKRSPTITLSSSDIHALISCLPPFIHPSIHTNDIILTSSLS